MKRLALLLSLGVLVALLSTESFGQYVVTDDDPAGAPNSSTIYKINSNGTLTQVKVLQTGGTGLGGGFFAEHGTTVTQNATCLFVVDAGSDDIAAFRASSFTRVGNFSNAALSFSASDAGGSIALTPNGKYLYGGYSGSGNVGEWKVNSDCSLTFIGTYTPGGIQDEYSDILPTPDGKYLIIPQIDSESAELAAINPITGSLTDTSNVNWVSINSKCQTYGCFPTGIDVTKDGKVAIFGDAAAAGPPSLLTASISGGAFSNPKEWDMTNSCSVGNLNNPRLSYDAYGTGNGLLYASGGYGTSGISSGIVTTNFSESTGLSGATHCFAHNAGGQNFDGLIQSCKLNTRDGIVVAEFFNDLSTFVFDRATGALVHIADTTDPQANGALSFSIYPAPSSNAPATARCH